jgi:integrase
VKIATQKQVETAPPRAAPYACGQNLYLNVGPSGSRQWEFHWKVNGRKRYAGLGSASGARGHKVSLIEARKKADHYRALVNAGKDPRQEERRQGLTLRDAVKAYVDRHRSQWRSAETPIKWLLSIEVHAKDIADRPMASLVAADLRPVIDRYWHRDCGRELRFRLETLFRDNRSILGDDFRNPASREALGIGRRHKGKVKHHAAMSYEKIPAFVASLDPAIQGQLPLKLLILTATRTSEVVGARWNEFDLDNRLWTIPAHRVKNGTDHHVPLTNEILAVLASLDRKDGEERLFPSCQPYTMLDMLKRKIPGCSGYTVHGFRSSFRDWCGNETAFAREVVEETYGHDVGSEVERAYRRNKGLAKRRQVLEAWNGYVMGGGKVIRLRRAS